MTVDELVFRRCTRDERGEGIGLGTALRKSAEKDAKRDGTVLRESTGRGTRRTRTGTRRHGTHESVKVERRSTRITKRRDARVTAI
jgi:hypothetical protein